MKTGFIGAGKVGFSLGKMFAESGLPLTGYYSRQRESAEEAANFTGTHAYSDLCELVQDSDAIFLTVPDRAITPVYLELRSFSLSGKQICHCSGALSARDAFPGIEETGALGLSIHPLFPVSSRYDSYRELADAFFCLEGDFEAVSAWKPLLERCGFEAEDFGGGDVLIRQIPSDVDVEDAKALLQELAGKLLAGKTLDPNGLRDELLHSIACKSAIKAGWQTSDEELRRLVQEVLTRDDIKYCPHGRPVCIELTRKELEKQFKRT